MTDDRGQGLALVIILTAFIFVMGSAAVALATSLRRNTGSEIRQKKANYIAEAGIEKAVPIIRCGQLSLEDLDSDEGLDLVPDYISPNYAGGLIEYVRVSGENGNENEIILLIESLGTYQEACCTLQARIKVDMSLDFRRGLWISSPMENPSLFYPGSCVQSDLYTCGALHFLGNLVDGDIYTGGDIVLADDTYLTGDIKGKGMFTAGAGCQVVGNVQVTGDVQVEDNAVVEGDIRAAGDVVIQKAFVSGGIWSNSEIFVDEEGGQVEGGLYPGQSIELKIKLPSFPEVDLSFFRKGADNVLKGLQLWQGSLKLAGLTYIDGDLEIAGEYTGKGIIVVDGAVCVTGDLIPGGLQDSLCIMAAGPVTVASDACAFLLIYGQDEVSLGEGSELQGSITAYTLQMGENANFIYQDSMVDKFQPSSLVTLSILSWKRVSPALSY